MPRFARRVVLPKDPLPIKNCPAGRSVNQTPPRGLEGSQQLPEEMFDPSVQLNLDQAGEEAPEQEAAKVYCIWFVQNASAFLDHRF